MTLRRLPLPWMLALALALCASLAAPAAAHDAQTDHRDTVRDLAAVDLEGVVEAAREGAGVSAQAVDGLPERWCGARASVDRPAPAGIDGTRPHFKLVYAYAADQPDRSAAWSNDIQATVAHIQRYLSAQSGGGKGLRFDMGTPCGPQYVDVQVVPLASRRSAYIDNFRAVTDEVWYRTLPSAGPRNLIVFADGLSGQRYRYGEGEFLPGADQPGAANPHNRGNLMSVMWGRQGEAAPTAGDPWWTEGYLHEMTHNLGAVQWSAPHSTMPRGQTSGPYGHCWDGFDVMCYRDGPAPAQEMTYPCPRISGVLTQTYDCGGDDYFNPAPAEDNYLATAWNVYDSAFLASCEGLGEACGTTAGEALPRPPVNTAAPTVSGRAGPDGVLFASAGIWLNDPSRYEFRWQRFEEGGWVDVDGIDGQAYAVGAADLGTELRVVVVATNDDGEAAAQSEPVAVATSRRGAGAPAGP